MNLPNKLTLTRILMVPLMVIIYLFPYEYIGLNEWNFTILNATISFKNIAVLLIFATASITDYFDGMIARKNKTITTFGKFADPIADKLLINTIFLLLVSDGRISILIPIIMISRDTVVDAIRLMAASKNEVIAANIWGKVKTVLQIIAIIVILIDNFPFSYLGIPVDEILLWASAIASVGSGVNYYLKGKSLILESM